jgi:hypothetical protein
MQVIKVRLRTTWAGPKGCFFAGDIIEVPPAAAKRMFAAREADPVESEKEIATAPPPESAAQTKRPSKKAVKPPPEDAPTVEE